MAYTEEKKQEVLRLLATKAGNNTTRCAQLTGISKTTILHWKKTQEIAPPFPPHTPASSKQNNPDDQTVPGTLPLPASPNNIENTQETSHPTLQAHPQTSYSRANSTVTAINALPTPSTHATPVPPPAASLRSASLPAEKSSRPLPINHPLSSGNLPDPTALTRSAATPEISETPEEAPLPTPSELKHRIIRRVSQLIDTCTDPKKLMDTHEALSKSERDSVPPTQETLFDLLSRQLSIKK